MQKTAKIMFQNFSLVHLGWRVPVAIMKISFGCAEISDIYALQSRPTVDADVQKCFYRRVIR